MTPRNRRRTALRRRALLAALAGALVAAVPVAWASHEFTDVPNSNPFHAEISALSDAGITSGKTCDPPGTPPTFCPQEPVVRQSMAAFLNRGLGRIAQETVANAPDVPAFGTVTVVEEDMTVPGVAGSQAVKVEAWATIDDVISDSCEISATIVQDLGTAGETPGFTQFARAEIEGANTDVDFTIHAASAFRTSSGAHTYSLVLGDFDCDVPDMTIAVAEAAVIATTYPFDQSGGATTLGGAAASRSWREEMARSEG